MRVTLDSFPASRVGTLVLLAVSLGLLLASGSAVAGVVTQRYDFNEPVIKTIEGYDRVSMDGAWSYGDPGEPVLPVAGARLLLPPGETVVSVTIIPGRKVHLGDGYSVEPGQRQYPLSHRGPVRITDPDPGLYESPAPFPASLHGEAEQGLYRGYRIASVPLNPVEYVPSTGSLSYYRTMEVEIRTESDVDVARTTSHRIRHDDATLSRLARHIDNPGQVASYASVERVREASRALDPALAYDYVIITTGAWEHAPTQRQISSVNRSSSVVSPTWIPSTC